jgi:hypothetical protein
VSRRGGSRSGLLSRERLNFSPKPNSKCTYVLTTNSCSYSYTHLHELRTRIWHTKVYADLMAMLSFSCEL